MKGDGGPHPLFDLGGADDGGDLSLARRVLDGVLHQVVEDFDQAFGISQDMDVGRRLHLAQLHAGLARHGLMVADDELDQVVQPRGFKVQLDPASVNVRELEDFFDQVRQVLHALRQHFHIERRFLRLPGQELRVEFDGGDGGSQLVGDVGDEARLHAFQRFELRDVVKGHDDGGLLGLGVEDGSGVELQIQPRQRQHDARMLGRMAGELLDSRPQPGAILGCEGAGEPILRHGVGL